MNTKDFEIMINLYFDDELTKNEEAVLFSSLSKNAEARECFKELNQLKNLLHDSSDEFPGEAEEVIFNHIRTKETRKHKNAFINRFIPAFSYAVSIILLVVSLFLFFKMKDYNNRIESLAEAVKTQNVTIELLLNSLPAVQVQTIRENKVVVYPN